MHSPWHSHCTTTSLTHVVQRMKCFCFEQNWNNIVIKAQLVWEHGVMVILESRGFAFKFCLCLFQQNASASLQAPPHFLHRAKNCQLTSSEIKLFIQYENSKYSVKITAATWMLLNGLIEIMLAWSECGYLFHIWTTFSNVFDNRWY